MTIFESGHFYKAKGPTVWSEIGWNILQKVKASQDLTLLFIDDVHELEDMAPVERDADCILFEPVADHIILESSLIDDANTIFSQLLTLPKKKAPKQNEKGIYHYGGFIVKHIGGFPSCALLDAGLTLRKHLLGTTHAVNILPFFYEQEQKKMQKIIRRTLPSYSLDVILYDKSGNYWSMK